MATMQATRGKAVREGSSPGKASRRCSVSYTYWASPHTARHARELLQSFCYDYFIPWTIDAEELCLAVHEAAQNAVKHGCGCDTTKRVRVAILYCPACRAIQISVSDPGPGFDTSKPLRTEFVDGVWVSASGRLIMGKACDTVSYRRECGWWVCEMVKGFRLAQD